MTTDTTDGTDQVNSVGVSDDNSPDPSVGGVIDSGALSKIGTKADTQSRVAASRDTMAMLRKQYGDTSGQVSNAYAAQQKALEQATQRLLGMDVGPSEEEARLRMASIPGEASTGRYDPGAHNAKQADILQARREAEMQKNQLIQQYGMQIPQSQIGAGNARLSQLAQLIRSEQSDVNSSAAQADKAVNAPQKTIGTTGMVWSPQKQNADGTTGGYEYHPEIAQAANDQKAIQAKNAQAAKVASAALSVGNISPENLDFAATWLHDKGTMPPGYQSRMSGGQVNPATTAIYKRMLAMYPNESASQVIANQGMIAESQKVLDDFSKGATSKQLNGLNTAVEHINILRPAIANLNNGPVGFANYVKNNWNQKIMGEPAPTDFAGIRDFVVGEISKAVLPNGGGEAERQELAKSAGAANSSDALNSIVDKWQKLLAGKTVATKQQWDTGSMGRFGEFNTRYLTPATRQVLGIQDATQPVQQVKKVPINPLVASYLPGGANYKPPVKQ